MEGSTTCLVSPSQQAAEGAWDPGPACTPDPHPQARGGRVSWGRFEQGLPWEDGATGSRRGCGLDLPPPSGEEADQTGRQRRGSRTRRCLGRPGGLACLLSRGGWGGGGGELGEGRRQQIALTQAENSLQNFISSARRRWGQGWACALRALQPPRLPRPPAQGSPCPPLCLRAWEGCQLLIGGGGAVG